MIPFMDRDHNIIEFDGLIFERTDDVSVNEKRKFTAQWFALSDYCNVRHDAHYRQPFGRK